MADLTGELEALKREVAEAQKARAKRQADLDLVKARHTEATDRLRELGARDIDHAKELQAEVEAELATLIERARAKVGEAGA